MEPQKGRILALGSYSVLRNFFFLKNPPLSILQNDNLIANQASVARFLSFQALFYNSITLISYGLA
jgi:hypothetical protein